MSVVLLPKNMIKPNDICFDGRVYDRDNLPEDYVKEKCVLGNYIDINDHSRGYCTASSQTYPFRAQNLFYKSDLDVKNLNENVQWLSKNTDTEKEDSVAYTFTSGENFYLREVNIVARLGLEQLVGKKCPTPRLVVVEHIPYGSTEWEAFSDPILLGSSSFLETKRLCFDNDSVLSTAFKLRIINWHCGMEMDMLTGLYKLEFLAVPGTKVRVPKVFAPTNDFIYVLNRDDITSKSEVSCNIEEDNKSKSVSSLLTKYDGSVIDLSEYKKAKFDVVLAKNDTKEVFIESKEDTIIFFNNSFNKGTLIINGDKPFLKDEKKYESLTLYSSSVLLYTKKDYYLVDII